MWPTYERSVAVIVQRYIPSHGISFLSPTSPSRSRICGGWVQALPCVSHTADGFQRVLLPAARALVMSMMITDAHSRRQYLDTYGDALRGLRTRVSKDNNSIDSAVSMASMCLTLSETSAIELYDAAYMRSPCHQVMMPTTSDGWMAHIQGVAAMMHSRGPLAFSEGIPHLLFVGFRPLIVSRSHAETSQLDTYFAQVLEALIMRRVTFLMQKAWRTIPFSTQHPSPIMLRFHHSSSRQIASFQAPRQCTDPSENLWRYSRDGSMSFLDAAKKFTAQSHPARSTRRSHPQSYQRLALSSSMCPRPTLYLTAELSRSFACSSHLS
jgi:hypothetical protein